MLTSALSRFRATADILRGPRTRRYFPTRDTCYRLSYRNKEGVSKA